MFDDDIDDEVLNVFDDYVYDDDEIDISRAFDDDKDGEVLKVFDDYVFDDDDIDISRAFDPLLYENG